MASSIYSLQGTKRRKGNISFSLDTQNATCRGGTGCKLRLAVTVTPWGGWGRLGEQEIKRKTGRQGESVFSLTSAQSRYCWLKSWGEGCRHREG